MDGDGVFFTLEFCVVIVLNYVTVLKDRPFSTAASRLAICFPMLESQRGVG